MNNEKYYLIKITFSYYSYLKYIIERHEKITRFNINNFEYEHIKEYKNLSHGFVDFMKNYKYDKHIFNDVDNELEKYFLICEKYGIKYIEVQSLPNIKIVSDRIKLKIFEECVKNREIYNKNDEQFKKIVLEKLEFEEDTNKDILNDICNIVSKKIDESKKGLAEIIEEETKTSI